MAYSKDVDYKAKIDEAIKNGDYASASRYEQSRNEKIEKEGLSYEKTYNYTKPNGVSDVNYNKANSSFNKSNDVNNWDSKTENSYSNLESISNEDAISNKTWNKINNSGFVVPGAVREADAYLASQLQKIQSGKTSYSDQVKEMMDKIANREKFSYDVDTDPLFQQALASAMNSGKQAMQDTIGQASALTGGYGSTYATTAGNQAYNDFIEDAYDNLPQYYQMAMEAYQMEGDEMYRQLGMYNDADDKEYNRNVTAYDATYQHRNRMYDETYQMFRDNKSDAFAIANLELNEHGQKVSDAYNLYNATSNQADKLYQREYNSWLDSVNMAYQMMQMQNNDWWNQTNFDYQVKRDEVADSKWEKEFALNEKYTNAQIAKMNSSGSGVRTSNPTLKEPTETQKKNALKAYNEGGMAKYKEYIDSLPSDIDLESIDMYVRGDDISGNQGYGVLPLTERTFTLVDDGGKNFGWGVDKDGIVKDQYENKMSMEDIYNELKGTMGAEAAKKWVVDLQYKVGIDKMK